MEEENQENPENQEPRVQVGPHPLGGVGFTVRDLDGVTHQARVELPEAIILAANLQALITMAFSQMYAQAAQASQIVRV